MSWNLSQALEKGRDRHNKCAVALADIEKCHDSLPWGACLQGFLRRGIPLTDACAIFRVMRCPTLRLVVGVCTSRQLQRTRSALTGNPLAALIARVPVEDSLSLARHEFDSAFILTYGLAVDAQSWSDNLACVAETPLSAARNLDRWAFYLRTLFHMRLKPSSMAIVPARTKLLGESTLSTEGGSWRVVDRELVLGTWLTGTGEDKSDRLSIMSSWNRIFWKNAKYLTNIKASPSARLKFWKILSFGVSDFRFPGIRPCRKSGDELEAYFNKFFKWIVKAPPRDVYELRYHCRGLA